MLEDVARSPQLFWKKILSICDSKVTVCARGKGRSLSYGLLTLLQRRCGIQLSTGLRGWIVWIFGEVMPMDWYPRNRS